MGFIGLINFIEIQSIIEKEIAILWEFRIPCDFDIYFKYLHSIWNVHLTGSVFHVVLVGGTE